MNWEMIGVIGLRLVIAGLFIWLMVQEAMATKE